MIKCDLAVQPGGNALSPRLTRKDRIASSIHPGRGPLGFFFCPWPSGSGNTPRRAGDPEN